MNNSISITKQNLTLASAQRAAIDNTEGIFQVVAFRIDSEDSTRSELPTATGLTIEFDSRLKVLGDEDKFWFLSRIYTADGRTLGSRAHGGNGQKKYNDNKFFVMTADDNADFNENGYYLYYACIQFPSDVAVNDEFNITIKTSGTDTNYNGETFDVEFLCVNGNLSDANQTAQNTWTAGHIQQGKFTIVE